jgi:hypothetical protein
MKKIHMSREQLVAEAIDLIAEDVQTQAFDGEILPDLLSLIPTEKLIAFLPADEEDEERRAGALYRCQRQVQCTPTLGELFFRWDVGRRTSRVYSGSLIQSQKGSSR